MSIMNNNILMERSRFSVRIVLGADAYLSKCICM